MKKSSLFAALLVGATLLGISPARAALVYNSGDLFLGFRSTSDSENYLVNIGNVSQFANLSPGASVSVYTGGGIGADLTTAFGSGWATRSDLYWGVIGTTYDGVGNFTATLYASRPRLDAATPSSPWIGRSNSGQISSVSEIQALAILYKNQGVATPNSTKGTFQDVTTDNSWADLVADSNDFGVGGSIEGSFLLGAGSTGSVLDLYRIDPTYNQAATLLGSFTISSTGAVTFTAVPEPNTIALFALGGIGLFLFLRRRARDLDL